MSVIEYLGLFLSAFLGGIVAFRINEFSKSGLKTILSFAGAFVLGIVVLKLLPEVFSLGLKSTPFWILGGFLLQVLLEQLSRGVEHGHIHAHHKLEKQMAFQILLGLSIHAFIEGLPLGSYAGHEHDHGILGDHLPLFFGIVIHKMPAAFAIGMLMKVAGYSKRFIIMVLLIFALMSPAGSIIGENFALDIVHLNWMMGLVIGSFLHISTIIIFENEENHNHHISIKKILAIFGGISLSILMIY